MADQTIFVHVGMTKTGSTAIQHAAEQFRSSLTGQGLLYPKTERGLNHHSRIWGGGADELIKEMLNFPGNSLISAENLYRQAEAPAYAFFEKLRSAQAKVCILFFVRKQVDWLQSIYQQYLVQFDHRFTGSLDAFQVAMHDDLNYHATAIRFRDMGFNVVAMGYDRLQEIGTLLTDSFAVCGIEAPIEARNFRPNRSVSREGAEIIQHINTLGALPERKAYEALVDWLKTNSNEHDKFGYLSPAEASKINAAFAPSNQALAREFMPEDHRAAFLRFNPSLYQKREPNPFEVARLFASLWRQANQ